MDLRKEPGPTIQALARVSPIMRTRTNGVSFFLPPSADHFWEQPEELLSA
ncbi:MAG TPA: hypothetical protein VHZ51_28275 [Ktedonobacteraceae bacterium]|jgi:hypothetical protein|nr:hypothetical protein [Ktedonobacteraceae bacterium]